MGRNSKARRDARKRARPQQRSTATPSSSPRAGRARSDGWEAVARSWSGLLSATSSKDPDWYVARLAEQLAGCDRALVDDLVSRQLSMVVASLWSNGWQPREVARQARLSLGSRGRRLVEVAIHADHAARPGQPLDPRWAAQLHNLGQREVSLQGSWLATWRDQEALSRAQSYQTAAAAVTVLAELPRIDVLVPPPGEQGAVATSAAARDAGAGGDPVLRRIRKLLAKAEASDFEAEAATLTAKAQELMTKHAIDLALLAQPAADDVPSVLRLPVDAPYADAKGVLLSVVAQTNRCRAIGLGRLRMSVVHGYPGDLVAVELLFTSLLVQAHKALVEAERRHDLLTTTSSFRASFFVGFANRIGERLAAATDQVIAESQADAARGCALPVLRTREQTVVDVVQERYADSLVSSTVRGARDRAGAAHGRRAADRARLSSGELLG